MDQAKFRVPRNTAATKQFDGVWKPSLHVTGVIVHGVGEWYYMADSDTKKDSNAQATIVALVLDEVKEVLAQRGLTIPPHLVVHGDNTPREGKNQWFVLFNAALVLRGKVISSMMDFGTVGHTHFILDQRFSIVGQCLKRSEVLQTPDDFVQRIQDNLKPVQGRPIFVRKLGTTHDHQLMLASLDVGVSGIVSLKDAPEANHCFRFVRRRDLGLYEKPSEEDWEVDDGGGVGHPHDVVLLVKHWMHSKTLSQRPIVVLPFELLDKLQGASLKPASKNMMSDRELTEFRKAGRIFAEEPWGMTRTKEYLDEWCRMNAEKDP
jgi:hypothetical protein